MYTYIVVYVMLAVIVVLYLFALFYFSVVMCDVWMHAN